MENFTCSTMQDLLVWFLFTKTSFAYLYELIDPLGTVRELGQRPDGWNEVIASVNLNITSMLLLTSFVLSVGMFWNFDFHQVVSLIRAAKGNISEAFIVQISSLAAKVPFSSWGLYNIGLLFALFGLVFFIQREYRKSWWENAS
jgi:hypothetical protein